MELRRRHLLALTVVGFGGCLERLEEFDTNPLAAHDGHPFDGATVTVAVTNTSTTSLDVERIARESLEYWEESAETYAGFSVEFERRETDNPDIRLEFVDDADVCGDLGDENVLGCAPLVLEGMRLSETLTAYVVAADRPHGKVRRTTKHELGHILGLDHDDEPLYIMSNEPAKRIPEYERRIDVQDTYREGMLATRDGIDTFNRGVEAFNDAIETGSGTFGEASTNAQRAEEHFVDANERFSAAGETASKLATIERVETVDVDRLEAIFELVESVAPRRIEMAIALGLASEASDAGNTQEANEHRDEMNAIVAELNEVDFPTGADVAYALGLVDGIDEIELLEDGGQ